VIGAGNFTTCSFSLSRNSSEYLIMFFTDIMLFYLMPLLLSVVLYSLIARTLLVNSRKGFLGSGGAKRGSSLANGKGASAMSVCEAAAKTNQARVQVSSEEKKITISQTSCMTCRVSPGTGNTLSRGIYTFPGKRKFNFD
jgi:hypothetical protein